MTPRTFGMKCYAERHRLMAYAILLARYERDVAEEMVQEVFCRAITKRHLFQKGTDLRAWLFCLLHNININRIRHDIKQTGVMVPVSLDVLEAGSYALARDGSQESAIEYRETIEALDRLPMQVRRLVAMAADGTSYAELGQRLGLSVPGIRGSLCRGREQLRLATGRPERKMRRRSRRSKADDGMTNQQQRPRMTLISREHPAHGGQMVCGRNTPVR